MLLKNKTKLIGILNLTDDSFSDGGKYTETKDAVTHIKEMIKDCLLYTSAAADE